MGQQRVTFYIQWLNGMRMELKKKECQYKLYAAELRHLKVWIQSEMLPFSKTLSYCSHHSIAVILWQRMSLLLTNDISHYIVQMLWRTTRNCLPLDYRTQNRLWWFRPLEALSFKQQQNYQQNKLLKYILCLLFLRWVLYAHNAQISALPANYSEQMVLMPAQKFNLQFNP